MISSLTNETIKGLVRLHRKKGRDEANAFLVEGEHLLQEAKLANISMKTYGTHGCDELIAPHVAEKLSQTKSGSTVFARIEKPDYTLTKGFRYFLCDGVQDPGNLGTIIRTAHSFGFDAVVVSPDCVDEYNDKVIRSTQGSIFHIPVIRMDLLEAITQLHSWNVLVYSSALNDNSKGLSLVEGDRIAVVMGSEGSGVKEEVLLASDDCLKIETSQFESLNVAVASGIIAYHLRKEA